MPGSGAMGSNVGNWEFDSQTNHNADCIPEEDRFKFVDDLSLLEIVNLINIGIASHNFRWQVPNDIPLHGQIIPANHLKSQGNIEKITYFNMQQLISYLVCFHNVFWSFWREDILALQDRE